MNDNIKIDYVKTENMYLLRCHINNIQQDNSTFYKLLNMNNQMFTHIISNQQTIGPYNNIDISFEFEDDCYNAIRFIQNNIGRTRIINENCIYVDEMLDRHIRRNELELYKDYRFYMVILAKSSIITIDEEISRELGLTVDEYYDFLATSYCDYKIINSEIYFHTADDCKKAIDLLADNYEELKLIRSLLNVKESRFNFL